MENPGVYPPPYALRGVDLRSWLSSVTTLDSWDTMSGKGPDDERRTSGDVETRAPPYRDRDDDLYDDSDEDIMPAANDRLLPFGTFDDDISVKHGSTRRLAACWIRSRSQRVATYYRGLRKRYSDRTLILAGTFGLLLASVISLAISTGILARQKHVYQWDYYTAAQTRIPWIWDSRDSLNYELRLTELYPPLSSSGDFSCKAAWLGLKWIKCHEKVLNRAWDSGQQTSLFEPRYDLYADIIGDEKCVKDLEFIYQQLSSQCTSKDRFDTTGYVGPMTADPYLEDGPVSAVHTLLKRAQHASRRPPYTVPDLPELGRIIPSTCATELYHDWFIVDGMNSGNLNGIDTFIKGTSTTGMRNRWDERETPSDPGDRAFSPERNFFEYGRKVGPGAAETSCSWCLLNWFDRKLQAWERDTVKDPINGTLVPLPTYLRTIDHAGRRCQTNDWDRIFRKNVEMYEEKGWLPEEWKLDDSAPGSVHGRHPGNATHPSQPSETAKQPDHAMGLVDQT